MQFSMNTILTVGEKMGRIISVNLVLLLMLSVVLSGCLGEEKEQLEKVEEMKGNDSGVIKELQGSSNQEDINRLIDTIQTSSDNGTRERAIFELAESAKSKNESEEIIDFLERVAQNDRNNAVRSAAYTNLDIIQEENDLEENAELEIQIHGEIKEGNTITVVLVASSKVKADDANVAMVKIMGTNYKVYEPIHFSLNAKEAKEIPFEVYLEKDGDYVIQCAMKLRINDLESQLVKKEIYMGVGKENGTYTVVESNEEPEEDIF